MSSYLKEVYKLKSSYIFRRKKNRFSSKFKKTSGNNVYKPFVLDSKCIFVHIPKSAGKSIALAVYGDDKPGHYLLEDYQYFNPEAYERSFKFAFVREPVSRFISAYNFLASGGSTSGDRFFKEKIIDRYEDINSFVELWLANDNLLIKEHFVPQVYFTHIDGEMGLDFLGYFETLSSDYIKLQEHIHDLPNLPYVNQGTKNKTTVLPQTRALLKELYKADYAAFEEGSPW